jgi:hypothetical protein
VPFVRVCVFGDHRFINYILPRGINGGYFLVSDSVRDALQEQQEQEH